MANGVVFEDPNMVRQVVVNHFSSVFTENWKSRPKLSSSFLSISLANSKDVLEVEFCEAEIWAAIQDCDVNKDPWLDGFNLSCIQKCWSIMKGEFIKIFQEFHNNGKMAKEWRKTKKKGIIPKLDFEKAYDSVNWEFLLSMMVNFGFGEKWVRWITSYISTSRISVLVNRSPTVEFSPQKGLRQGDPLSPFLFNIVVEGLNLLLEKAKERGLIRGASVGPNELKISHLEFADESIISHFSY
ncbi:uncharacterized protein LOC114285201 [Camellia sinensis]|uniref:uncharacterized protein LOC114285201 n=1 Tax=Camellia sinensis TaxID=4442 RepID=UPI0010362DF7|nr:uncharacterized protein LOC114285201 [Camellia sinensis]